MSRHESLSTGSSTYGQPMRTFTVALHEERWRTRWLRRYKVSWWAESADLPGWFAAADTRSELVELVMPGLRFHTEDEKSWFQVFYVDVHHDFDPDAAGRRAVRKHGDALRRLAE